MSDPIPPYATGYDTLPGPPPVGCDLTPEQAAGLQPIPDPNPQEAR